MAERALIAAARNGDERAIAELYERYAGRVRGVVARWVRDPSMVDDLSQDAWVRAIRGLASFRGDCEFGTWLHTIARNVAVCWSRGERRREDRLRERPVPRPTQPERVDLRVDLERVIRALPPGMRDVLWLHDVEGWTHEEIGRSMGVAAGTSKSQLFKARARAREALRGGAEYREPAVAAGVPAHAVA